MFIIMYNIKAQKSPDTVLCQGLKVGSVLLSHLVQYHRRCGA